MGKLVGFRSASLERFFEGPGRDITWHSLDDVRHRHGDVLRGTGAFLDGFASIWLQAAAARLAKTG